MLDTRKCTAWLNIRMLCSELRTQCIYKFPDIIKIMVYYFPTVLTD